MKALFFPIFHAVVRIWSEHWRTLLRPTGALVVSTLLLTALMGGGLLLALLSATGVLEAGWVWLVAMALFFLGRVSSAPLEIFWLKKLSACLRNEPDAPISIGVGEVFEALVVESIRGPIVFVGFMMCILPGLVLRPLLFLPESALANGRSIKEAFQLAVRLIRTRLRDIVLIDFGVALTAFVIGLLPMVGYFLVLPALLTARFVMYLDLSGELPADQICPTVRNPIASFGA